MINLNFNQFNQINARIYAIQKIIDYVAQKLAYELNNIDYTNCDNIVTDMNSISAKYLKIVPMNNLTIITPLLPETSCFFISHNEEKYINDKLENYINLAITDKRHKFTIKSGCFINGTYRCSFNIDFLDKNYYTF